MKNIWTICKKELFTIYNSLIGYIIIIIFLALTGAFTWMNIGLGIDVFFNKQASLFWFFFISELALLIFIPAITMRVFSEESKTGTIELLLTKPILDFEIVAGKFLATFILMLTCLLLTLPYYFTISFLGNVDHAIVLTGYLELILVSAAYLSVGIFISSIVNDQIVSFILTIIVGLVFGFFIRFYIYILPDGFIRDFYTYLSINSHIDDLKKGVIDSKDLIYFFSVIFISLLSTEIVLLNKRN